MTMGFDGVTPVGKTLTGPSIPEIHLTYYPALPGCSGFCEPEILLSSHARMIYLITTMLFAFLDRRFNATYTISDMLHLNTL